MNREEMWPYFLELHQGNPQEGPGNHESTKRALEMLGELPPKSRILDLGCGPGRQTLDLLRLTEASVTALDNHQEYLDQLTKSVHEQGFSERLGIVLGDMAQLNFSRESFDLIWSEGALYSIGFEEGLKLVSPLLKKGGGIAVSELTAIATGAPEEGKEFWQGEYPAMKDIAGNLELFESVGFTEVKHFVLPECAWWDYYNPMIEKHRAFREKYAGNKTAMAVLEFEEKEIEMVRRYSDYFGYVFYVARRP